ncbi:MAG: hypothetical protein IKC24_00850 [Oscillospiraceae bacterium]|nr:hypothetical protein [Oscillospiraceae bacterium]
MAVGLPDKLSTRTQSGFFFFSTASGASSFSWQDKEKEDGGLKQPAPLWV